jgi:regulator of replication initiation timing
MPADNRATLATATRQRAETTRARAHAALRQLDHDGTPITVTAVANAAQVSRNLLYRDPALRAEIERLRTRGTTATVRRPATEQASDASIHQRLETLLADNHALREDNRQLRDQIAALLGERRADSATHRPRPQLIGPCS